MHDGMRGLMAGALAILRKRHSAAPAQSYPKLLVNGIRGNIGLSTDIDDSTGTLRRRLPCFVLATICGDSTRV